MLKTILFPNLLLFALVLVSFTSKAQNKILGEWLTSDGNTKILIYEEHGKFHGKISWISKISIDQSKSHGHHSNKTSNTQPLLGTKILINLIYEDSNKWTSGMIYDPANNEEYKCNIFLTNDGKLEVRGYMVFSLFGRTEIWTR